MIDVLALGVAVTAGAVGLGALGWAWRGWRRVAVLRQNLGALEVDLGEARMEIVGLAHRVLLARYRQLAGGDQLARLPLRSCSQHGEDLMLWELLGEKLAGYFVEAGAHDGVTFSNSYFFEAIGWTGLLVEPHPQLYARCRASRPGSRVVQAAVGRSATAASVVFHAVKGEGGVDTLSYTVSDAAHASRIRREGGVVEPIEVPNTSLDALLEAERPAVIDFVSIDVEGAELEVLEGLRLEKWLPRVLVIEDNSRGRDRGVAEYVARFGYRREAQRGVNDFYVLGR